MPFLRFAAIVPATVIAVVATGCTDGGAMGDAAGNDDGGSGDSGVVDAAAMDSDDDANPSDGDLTDDGASDTVGDDDSVDDEGDPDDGDSGDGDSGGEDPPPRGAVPAFVAQGHMGRTMISCDDGSTWVADTSLDDSVRCFEPLDCDHHEGSATGLTYGDGLFVATWGWGTDGQVQTSVDGVEWTTVLTGPTFSGTAWGNDTFVAGAKNPYRADALAQDWIALPDSGLDEWTPRGIGFIDVDGGRFVLGGGGGDTGDVVVSATNGDDWAHPSGFDPACGGSISGIGGGGGTIVIATNEGAAVDACVSTDGGMSFVTVELPESLRGAPWWTGTELVGLGANGRMTSTDGLEWSSTPYVSSQPPLNAVARSPDGTYVAHRDGWLVWYDQQAMFRSVDGLTWTELPAESFAGGHPIRRVTFGYVQPHENGCDPGS